MALGIKFCAFLGAVALISAETSTKASTTTITTSCLKYLESCTEGSSNCCNYPIVSCLPDNKNGTACLFMYDVVNLNPKLSSVAGFLPLLLNGTGFLAESINVNGENVFNTTEKISPMTN